MDREGRYNIVVGVLCFLAFVALFVVLFGSLYLVKEDALRLPILVITGVMALFATLALVAVTFSVAGLSDETHGELLFRLADIVDDEPAGRGARTGEHHPGARLQAGGPVVSAKIAGKNLQHTKTVSLEMGTTKVQGVDVVANDQLIRCEFTIDPSLADGQYDVVITTSDDATATLPKAFEVRP